MRSAGVAVGRDRVRAAVSDDGGGEEGDGRAPAPPHGRGDGGADGHAESGQEVGATDAGGRGEGAGDLSEREPAHGQPAERDDAAQPFGDDVGGGEGGDGGDAAPVSGDGGEGGGEVRALEEEQQDEADGVELADPEQRRAEQPEPEQQAEQRPPLRPLPVDRHRQQGHARKRQRPETPRRDRQRRPAGRQ